MRGTVAFERLNCSNNLYVRILLNDAVYRKLPSASLCHLVPSAPTAQAQQRKETNPVC